MTTQIEPLQPASFNTDQLMAEHPPQLRVPNKRVVSDVACPPESTHARDIGYSRCPACPFTDAVSVSSATKRVEVSEGIYDHASASRVEGGMERHVSFADPSLFVAYGSGLFEQEEMQVAEHPALGALREVLDARIWPPRTEETGQPTPMLVKRVERRCRIAVESSAEEGRPDGPYGNVLIMAKPEAVRREATRSRKDCHTKDKQVEVQEQRAQSACQERGRHARKTEGEVRERRHGTHSELKLK